MLPTPRGPILALVIGLASASTATARAQNGKVPAPVAKSGDAAKSEARLRYEKGKVFFNAQKYDEAVAEFQAAYLVYPKADFLYNLGQAFRNAGQTQRDPDKLQRAVDAYERYLQENPRATDRADVAQIIGEIRKEIDRLQAERAKEEEAKRAAEAARREREAAEARERAEAEAEATRGRARLRLMGWATGGAGVALILSGAGLLIGAAVSAGDYNDRYQKCFPAGQPPMPCMDVGLVDVAARVRALDIAGPIVGGVGLLATGFGAWLLYRGREPAASGTPRVAFAPMFLAGGGGGTVTWIWP